MLKTLRSIDYNFYGKDTQFFPEFWAFKKQFLCPELAQLFVIHLDKEIPQGHAYALEIHLYLTKVFNGFN